MGQIQELLSTLFTQLLLIKQLLSYRLVYERMTGKNLAAPDGGWGWFIILAYAMFNFIYMPILQNFGLVFKDAFKEMGLTGTDTSVIININSAVCMFMGLANGPLLKRFSFRKVSVASAAFIVGGLLATAFTKSFVGLIITYGFVTSIGIGLGMCSYPLALNTYFVKKRNKATGLGLTITGLGSIMMPQLISALISYYDIQGAIVVIAGIALNTFVSATLLQPVKWHMIEQTEVADETPVPISSQASPDEIEMLSVVVATEMTEEEDRPVPNRFKGAFKTVLTHLVEAFDLKLMKDPQYVILMIGLALTLFSELNFSMLTPFILSDLGSSTDEIATFISVLSTADLVLRFVAPFIGDFFKLSARVLFLISLTMLSTTRFAIPYFTSFEILMVIAVILGIAKGIRTVYWSLILPEYLPLEKLGSAFSLEMVINGFVMLGGGPLLGVVRDVTGSYTETIYIMNAVIILTVLMWGLDILIRKRRKQNDALK